MSLLSSIYAIGLKTKNVLYDRGFLHTKELQGPVVSIGNLSVGGSGKTPFILLLGELLKARGIKFDVLSRGYGRKTQGVALVDPSGTARAFGDEPLLIARRLNVPVIVGESRYEAGLFAEEKFGAQFHLLDDGFQHRQLARDFDIVLVTQLDLDGALLPTGRLREPSSSLARADAVVLMEKIETNALALSNQAVWRVHRGIALDTPPARPVVFCGIARPERFMDQLRETGIQPAAHQYFRDHHSYTQHDINSLHKLRDQNHADGFITTEKDAVNLGKFQAELAPLSIARVTMELENPESAVHTILRIIEEGRLHS